ncbi:hypothetical protein O6H91_08G094000 [Diphasiastrum complanatum]|uniref:Uncharacterized protein n=1 Tax=Diphasiastrum complanatum TaxID=34168 RepID=A0ACC2D0A8_DIPCM|nr:hypothetical protein O6H91_08G094000 [Diphasiastrum complanatum]
MDSPRVPLPFSSYKILLPTHFLIVLSFHALISTVLHNLGDACSTYCGDIPLKPPFGTIVDGCGDPSYRLNCDKQNKLYLPLSSQFSYQIQSIDYDNHIINLNDFVNSTSCAILSSGGITYSPYLEKLKVCGNYDSQFRNISTLVFPVVCKSYFTKTSCAIDTFFWCRSDPTLCCAYVIPGTSDSTLTCGFYSQVPDIANPPPIPPGLPSPSNFNLSAGSLMLKYQNPSTQASSKKPNKTSSLPIGLSAGGAVVILGLIGVFLFLLKSRRIANYKDAIGFNPSSEQENVLMQKLNSGETTPFSYRELEIATDYFSETRLLGGGGFSSVYKGILRDGQIIAVKKLNQWDKQGMNQFHNEVTILSKVRHPNLVQLHGSCLEGRELLLVYEFVPNGTVADHLHGNRGKGLSWATRLRVAVETARALAYLHESVCPPIFHRDVKATNILLDASFHTKVGDFGLSRVVPMEVTHISTAPQGTPGYLDPDYYQSYQLTDKSDVYSFGVLLMEMISAKKAVDMSREKKEINLASLAISKIQGGALDELVDPNLEIQSKPEVKQMVTSVAELAFCCLSQEKDDRPCMKEVAEKLEQILQQGYGPSWISPQEDLMRAMDNSETYLLIKASPISPTSVIETKWLSSTDSSNNSKGEF